MAPTPADYGRLAPFGFEAVTDCIKNFESTHEAIRSLRANPFVLAGKAGSDLPSATHLNSASVNVSSLSTLPVPDFREVSAYSRMISILVPEEGHDAETLALALKTVAQRLSTFDTSQAAQLTRASLLLSLLV